MKKILLILLLLSCVSCSKTEIKEIEKPKEAFNSPFWYVLVETSATPKVYNENPYIMHHLSLVGCMDLTGISIEPLYYTTAKIGVNFTLYRALYKIPSSIKSLLVDFKYRAITEGGYVPIFTIPKYNLFNCYSVTVLLDYISVAPEPIYSYILPTIISCTYDEIKNEITDVYQKLD